MSSPKITAIVPHHLSKNAKYLELCVLSLQRSMGIDLEIIVVSDAENGDPFYLRNDFTKTFWNQELTNCTRKWHFGLEQARKESDYFVLVSDDVMVKSDTLINLCASFQNKEAIISASSNCDSTTRYICDYDIFVRKSDTARKLSVKEDISILEGDETYYLLTPLQDVLLPQAWVGFYCVMMPRSVIERVGKLDEELDCRHNDVDYCYRAAALGIPSFVHLGSFALHFGDKTLPACTSPEAYSRADQHMAKKYCSNPLIPEGDLL